MAQPPGLPARRSALRLIDAALRRGETLEQAESGALRDVRGAADRALARAIAGEVLRWLVDLDALIDGATARPLAADAKARDVLRMMLAQWLRLDTPPHAVIATGLPLLASGARRLAHGVFGTLAKRGAALPDHPTLPAAVRTRWGDRAEAIARGLAVPPPLDLTLKDAAQTAHWIEQLGGEGLAPGHVRLPRGTPIEALPGFNEGAWWVQDLAASLPARLLGAGEGRRVLDLCAAPGGKTMQLAAAGWRVMALDISGPRLTRLRANLARTGLEAEIVKADALTYTPAKSFDAVLLDAPCTATGTCRRHPEVLHRVGAEDIARMAALQAALLERAADWLAPGGTLVYAACSLEREEGEEQARRIPLEQLPVLPRDLPDILTPTEDGWLRTDPGMLHPSGGLDGFFVGRWRTGT